MTRVSINVGRRVVGTTDWFSLIKWFTKEGFSVDFDYAAGTLLAEKEEE